MRAFLLILVLAIVAVSGRIVWDFQVPSEWEGVQGYIPGYRREFVTAATLLAPGVWIYDSTRRLDEKLGNTHISSWVYIDLHDENLRTTTFSYEPELRGYLIQSMLQENFLAEKHDSYYFRHGSHFTEYMNETLDVMIFWPSSPNADKQQEIGHRISSTPAIERLTYSYFRTPSRGVSFLASEPVLHYDQV